ncbi:hypothetical protein [Metabacillus fastidiosus]|uniref:Phospholipid phosphatase n=1 Tax=Metabacillus fastidiosus TaxID=1458 RepID=A0ABU6P340_9BACI|nr:hypothetical protein [Metabacillus fastidiosus]MED4403338.1 hypothetical protein [Metabacillus fastidiosus]MED4460693.1 hypothetical protein [Metabacillus fastidiosus]
MDTAIYFLLSIAYIIIFIIGILLAKHRGWINISNVILIVILALLYDNGILALGKYLGEGELLRILNQMRYWLHAFVTPLLVLFAWHTLVNANLQWAKKRIVKWLMILLTLCLIIFELITIVPVISLEPAWNNGVLSYKKGEGADGPPIMIIGISIMLLVTSIIIWWKQKWPWYFVGILSMGIIPIINLLLKTDAPHNISEFLLMLAILATKAYQDKIIKAANINK